MRRESAAMRACFDLVEYCLGLDLPQYVHEDPVFITGYNAGMDLIALDNVRTYLLSSIVNLTLIPGFILIQYGAG
jgi:hypothetical protein